MTGPVLYLKAKRIIPGGTQLLSKRPEMFLPDQWPAYSSRAQGARVWDLDGRCYVDMSHMGVGTCVLGYADPDVNAAVIDAVNRGSICTLNSPTEVELAEFLCHLHPWAEMVRYARTGGESMSIAVRIARARTGRSKVAFCGYHGWSDWYLAANLSEDNALGKKGLLLPGLEPAGVPRQLAGTALTFRHGDLDALASLVHEHRHDLAAVICEPQRQAAPPPGFLEGTRDLCREVGAVLIFDEITSAFRKNTGGVHLLFGVEPDIAVFAKALGNGFPIAAVIGTADVMQAAQSTFISSTYWTECIGPAAALATIRKHQAVNAGAHLTAIGLRVQKAWQETAERTGLNADVGHREMPALSHLHFRYANARAVKTLHCQLMLERGFLDNGTFYSTCAHTDDLLAQYAKTLEEVFGLLVKALESDNVQTLLKGPVSHTGFARLM